LRKALHPPRSVGNFDPEWAHLAVMSRRGRSLLIASVALAVGATTSATVILSVADNPTAAPRIALMSAHRRVSTADSSEVAPATQDLPEEAEKSPPPAFTGTIGNDVVTAAPAVVPAGLNTGRREGTDELRSIDIGGASHTVLRHFRAIIGKMRRPF